MRGEPRRVGAVMLRTAGVIGAAALALALTFAVAFEPAFLAFHAIFFPPGTFLFEPGSNLITLFPEGSGSMRHWPRARRSSSRRSSSR